MTLRKVSVLENLFDVLQMRGFIENTTDDKAIRELLEKPVVGYIGFDPTASSLHVGSLVPIMALAHMQRQGHKPIALVGGATALVGDPSGKTEMRQMLTLEQVNENARRLKKQLARFINFKDNEALLLNNARWLAKLEYIPFLRDVGRHFSVNRMLASESCRLRLETGLSFIEFNYALLQAYDFLHLYRTENSILQMGGADQWGNIVAGIDLIRRMARGKAYGVTFPLITTSSGAKMGKTAKGAVWLDSDRTTPYEYYQFWVNTDDRDVERFLAFFTFLPMDEIKKTDTLTGAELNGVKSVLAFEATKLVHGEKQAMAAYRESMANFGTRPVPQEILPSSHLHREVKSKVDLADHKGKSTAMGEGGGAEMAGSFIEEAELIEGIPAFRLFHMVGLAGSRGSARRLIEQGGGYVNGRRLESFDEIVKDNDLKDGQIVLRAGKKRYHRIRLG
jgi:tyrosyl-tRNA synthetase